MQVTIGEARMDSLTTISYGVFIYEHASIKEPTKIYKHQLCENTGWNRKAGSDRCITGMNGERLKELRAVSEAWWWRVLL